MMRIAGIRPCSMINGEGIRYVIFLQGCAHRCEGCHNPETWNFNGGYKMDLYYLASDILKRMRHLDGITLSGGDPFYQQEACMELLKLLPDDLNVWIYTGFLYEEICDTELAKRANVIVDGPYIEELKCDGEMRGSSNQRFIRRES